MPAHLRRCPGAALSSRQPLESPAAAALHRAVVPEPPVGEDRSEGKQSISRALKLCH